MRRLVILTGLALLLGGLASRGERPREAGVIALKVLTFNIRYDNPGDGENRWERRREDAFRVIRDCAPDVMGTQEVLHGQLLELEEALPGYDREGVGREDGKRAGEYSALFFKRERFERVDGGTFWLSATPRVPGKGWDAACERVVTWVKLRERASGGIFLVFNTHFDHVGSVARRESALLLKRRAREIAGDAPVIVTGDFNATADGEPMQLLVNDPDRLVNASEATPRFTGPRHSYHDFGRLPAERRQLIDHILVKNARAVTLVQVLDLQATGSYISDHYPVLAIVEISPK